MIKELRSDRERIPREFTNAAATLIESQAREIEKLSNIARKIKTYLDADFLDWGEEWNDFMGELHSDVEEIKPATASEALS